jgi:hypothetical protein
MRCIWGSGFGFREVDGQKVRFGFSMAENQARETNKDNANALWLGGELTPLPPVKITPGNGEDGDYVIQDVEGMVDLSFKVKVPVSASFDLVATRSEYSTPLGMFSGMLLDKDGVQIPVKNLPGTIEKLYLRV